MGKRLRWPVQEEKQCSPDVQTTGSIILAGRDEGKSYPSVMQEGLPTDARCNHPTVKDTLVEWVLFLHVGVKTL